MQQDFSGIQKGHTLNNHIELNILGSNLEVKEKQLNRSNEVFYELQGRS